MHVGMSVIFQNPEGNAGDPQLDQGVYETEYMLADKAEALGFDSLWSVEHHLNGYAMCPNPLAFLTYFAGRTEKIKLGTMVVVMPWHHPIRICEDASVLDQVSQGRLLMGVGRGVAKREFDAFGIDMTKSRDLLIEGIAAVKMGMEQGKIEFHGNAIQQDLALIRPAPRFSFKNRIYGSAQSAETYPLFGKLGIGILFIPGQKRWEDIAVDLEVYRRSFLETHHEPAPPPIVAGWVFVDEDPVRARELGYEYIRGYVNSAMDHYDVRGAHMKGLKGYEGYGNQIAAADAAGFTADDLSDFFVRNHVFGTPDECFEQIKTTREKLGAGAFLGIFNYAGMGEKEAVRNQTLFAEKVLPRLKALHPELDIGTQRVLEAAS